MFKLSKGAEYAMAGLIYMATRPSAATGVEEISRATGISRQYLAKLFQLLAARGIVSSFRGRDGGFILAREPCAITLLDVVEAIEGPVEARCIRKESECPDSGCCQLYSVFRECAAKVADVLRGRSIEEVRLNFFGLKKD